MDRLEISSDVLEIDPQLRAQSYNFGLNLELQVSYTRLPLCSRVENKASASVVTRKSL